MTKSVKPLLRPKKERQSCCQSWIRAHFTSSRVRFCGGKKNKKSNTRAELSLLLLLALYAVCLSWMVCLLMLRQAFSLRCSVFPTNVWNIYFNVHKTTLESCADFRFSSSWYEDAEEPKRGKFKIFTENCQMWKTVFFEASGNFPKTRTRADSHRTSCCRALLRST